MKNALIIFMALAFVAACSRWQRHADQTYRDAEANISDARDDVRDDIVDDDVQYRDSRTSTGVAHSDSQQQLGTTGGETATTSTTDTQQNQMGASGATGATDMTGTSGEMHGNADTVANGPHDTKKKVMKKKTAKVKSDSSDK
jgi:hypothetical protein